EPCPERQFVAEIIAVVEKAAVLHQQAPGVDARAAVEPADRRLADELLDSGNGQPDVLALLLLAHGVIVDPTPAVADHLVPFLDERARQFGILQAAYHAENARLDIEALEDPQQPPAADP